MARKHAHYPSNVSEAKKRAPVISNGCAAWTLGFFTHHNATAHVSHLSDHMGSATHTP
jgi:hypothetical protein